MVQYYYTFGDQLVKNMEQPAAKDTNILRQELVENKFELKAE